MYSGVQQQQQQQQALFACPYYGIAKVYKKFRENKNKTLRVAWIPRIKAVNEASWKIIPEAALDHGGLFFLTNCNYDVRTLQVDNLPSFYLEVLKEWKNHKRLYENRNLLNQRRDRMEQPKYFNKW